MTTRDILPFQMTDSFAENRDTLHQIAVERCREYPAERVPAMLVLDIYNAGIIEGKRLERRKRARKHNNGMQEG